MTLEEDGRRNKVKKKWLELKIREHVKRRLKRGERKEYKEEQEEGK